MWKVEYDGIAFVVETRGFILTVFINPDNDFLDGALTHNVFDWKLFSCRIVGERLKQSHALKQTETATATV